MSITRPGAGAIALGVGRGFALAGVSVGLLFSSPLAQALSLFSQYDFTLIARTGSNGIERLNTAPSLNNAGTVAFTGFTSSRKAVFTGTGGPLTQMFSTSHSGPLIFNPIINNAGAVAFGLSVGLVPHSQEGIYLSESPNTATKIVDTLQPTGGIQFDGIRRTGAPFNDNEFSFNDSGQAAFFGSSGELTGIYSADTSDTLTTYIASFFHIVAANPVINNAGEVAVGVLADGGWHIARFTPSGPPGIDIAGPNDFPLSFLNTAPLDMNDAGTVAFRNEEMADREVIYTGRGNALTTVVDTSGPFHNFLDPAINNNGSVGFEGFLDPGRGRGIFRGPNPVTDKVIAAGDTLFGSRVTSVDMKRDGFNDNGSFSFLAGLSDGTSAIVRADPITFEVDPGKHDPLAALATLTGTGIVMSQLIPTPDAFFDILFDITFLNGGELRLMIGDREWLFNGARARGTQHILLEDIDPLSLFSGPSREGEVLIKFFLSGLDVVAHIDNIVIPGQRNGSFDVGYFDFWTFDTSGDGVASIDLADVDVPEPSTLPLLAFAAGVLVLSGMRRRSRKHHH